VCVRARKRESEGDRERGRERGGSRDRAWGRRRLALEHGDGFGAPENLIVRILMVLVPCSVPLLLHT
jgi:hypothetical protein